MARCDDCIHDSVCRMMYNLTKIDQFTWEELRNVENVEKFCKHFLTSVGGEQQWTK